MSRLAVETIDSLRALVKECVVHVIADNQTTNGTGFFISDRLVLTCAHVVNHKDASVQVHPYKRNVRPGRVVDFVPVNSGDMALIQTDPVDGESTPQPSVVLDRVLSSGQYLAVGHPADPAMPLGLEVIEYAGHPRDEIDAGDPLGLQLEGKQVTFGMSGGPVCSLDSGAVVAITRTSKDPNGNLGGGAIPISSAAQRFALVQDCLERPPASARRWRDVLGRSVWEQLGYQWLWETCVEIQVEGDRSHWRIRADSDDALSYELTVSKLGEEVSEALFQWAQRRRIRTKREVQLLGRLLSAALFPEPLAQQLAEARQADRVLVRLRIDPASDLADVPWEFATVPEQRDQFLATADGIAFVRVDKTLASERTGQLRTNQLRILAVVSQPEDLHFPDQIKDDKVLPWPRLPDVIKQLKTAAGACKVDAIDNPGLWDLGKLADSRDENNLPYDVFHYVGIGRLMPSGAQLGMADQGEHQWAAATQVFDCARRSGARVVVVELALAPPGRDDEPIPATALAAALQEGQVNALVCTRFPVHAREFHSFNTEFYSALSRGETVEEAVQKGRNRLQIDEPMYDAAAFGWFTLITGEQAGIRLVDVSEVSGPTPARRIQDLANAPTRAPSPEQRAVRDAFTG